MYVHVVTNYTDVSFLVCELNNYPKERSGSYISTCTLIFGLMHRCLSTCTCTNGDVSIAVVWKQPDNLVITTCICTFTLQSTCTCTVHINMYTYMLMKFLYSD